MEKILNHISNNYESYIEELKEFLRIPSVSALPEHKDDVQKCANFVSQTLKNIGVAKVEIFQTKRHPIVYGEWFVDREKPTVLIYGHYDVQPVDPIELWDAPPFEPVIKDNKIWARGATDDKGQMFTHIKSVEAFAKIYGAPPVNVKFILEGEEEIGSGNLNEFLPLNKELLKCDAVLISDTSLFAPMVPTITYGLRGLCYMEVEVTGPDRDLHSGSYGGAVMNPINALALVISKLINKDGKITIPNFYKDVVKLTPKEKAFYKKLKFSEREFAKEIGLKQLIGEKGYTTLERLWARPTLDCNGIIGGFTGDGAKTVIPSKAKAKISMRLVPNQDPKKIAKEFEKYIKTILPKGVSANVVKLHGAYAAMASIENKIMKAAAEAMKQTFKKETVFIREGGSIPIVVEFARNLNAPTILMGFGLNSENLHSPNEHFDLTHFKLGIESSARFLNILGNS